MKKRNLEVLVEKSPVVRILLRAVKMVLYIYTGRTHCFHDNIYIMFTLLLWDLSTLYVVDHLYIYIIYKLLYIFLHVKKTLLQTFLLVFKILFLKSSKVFIVSWSNFLKNRPPHKCFPVNFATFFKNTFFAEYLQTTASVIINPFYSSVTFLYPLKTSENQKFSDVFRGYRNATLD